MPPDPLYSHDYRLTLHTSSPTPPPVEAAFLFITAHRLAGQTPAQITHAQTLGGTLRAISVYPQEGRTKRRLTKAQSRPKRKEYRKIINDLLHLLQCDDGIDLPQFTRTVKAAKRILEK